MCSIRAVTSRYLVVITLVPVAGLAMGCGGGNIRNTNKGSCVDAYI